VQYYSEFEQEWHQQNSQWQGIGFECGQDRDIHKRDQVYIGEHEQVIYIIGVINNFIINFNTIRLNMIASNPLKLANVITNVGKTTASYINSYFHKSQNPDEGILLNK
jgi:hypothetical protein